MYDVIARYYDLIHADLTADVGFVLALAGRQGGPVLELGCGTGRLLLPLARAGHQVTGVDNAPAMLAQARQRLASEPLVVQQRVSLVEGEMTAFELDGQFNLVVIAYNTLMHLESQAMLATFKAIHRHLAPSGRLFLDLVNPLAVTATPDDRFLTLERTLNDPETGEVVLQLASSWVDQENQVLHITWLFDASPPAGGAVRRTVAQTRYHYLYSHELELLLVSAGLRLETLYGNYNQAPFEEESERLLALAGPG